MSSHDAIKRLFAALNRHSDTIAGAYLAKGSKHIPATQENDAAIQALLSHRMAWQLDDADGVQLSSVLTAVLDRVVRSARRLQIKDGVRALWDEMEGHLQDYKKAGRSEQDKEDIRHKLEENAHNLMEEIQEAIRNFGVYISRGYSQPLSLDIRIQQNSRVLARAEELIVMMETFVPALADFQKSLHTDSGLSRIFHRYLPRSFESALKDLRHIVGDLQQLMTKLREEESLSNLVRCFQSHYERNPGFEPVEPAMIDTIPASLNVAAPLLHPAYPNIYDDFQRDDLAELVARVSREIGVPSPRRERSAEPVAYAIDRQEDPPPPDVLYEAAAASMQHLMSVGGACNASTLYQLLGLSEPYDLWLYAFLNYINGMADVDRARLSVAFDETPDPLFSGNRVINDFEVGCHHDA